jgi:hypothetical protein
MSPLAIEDVEERSTQQKGNREMHDQRVDVLNVLHSRE